MQSYPPSILVDAGPLIALYRQRDTHHRRALEFAGACNSDLFTTWPMLTEAAHFLNERGRLPGRGERSGDAAGDRGSVGDGGGG